MVCGVHLGILLICLVQAEHVCCSWATQAQNSERQNSNRYVSVLQQDTRVKQLGDNYPQNQLRQASAWGSSFNTDTAVSSSYSQGLSGSGYTKALSQPAQSGYTSVRLVQSNSLSKPNWRVLKSSNVDSQKVPKKKFSGLSTSVVSGSSVSRNQNDLSRKRTWPVQQDTVQVSKYPSKSSASLQSASRESKPASYLSAVQRAAGAASETPTYEQRGYSPMKSSSLFSARAPVPQRNAIRMQTSASAPARRVTSRHSSKPSRFSYPQNERARAEPSQTGSGKPFQSKMFHVNGGKAQGSYKPTSTSSISSSYGQFPPVSNKQDARGNFQHSLATSTSQRLSYKPGYTSTEQIPRSTNSLKATWNNRNPAQGAHNLPDSKKGKAGTSAQRFAPTRTHNIPQRFGGYSIRRLKEPADKAVSIRKPQQSYTAPSQQSVSNKPQVQSVHQQSKWKKMRQTGTIAGAAGIVG